MADLNDSKGDLFQKERREFIEGPWTQGPWVRVCSFNNLQNDHISFYCALIPKKYESEFFRGVAWDFSWGDGHPAVWREAGEAAKDSAIIVLAAGPEWSH